MKKMKHIALGIVLVIVMIIAIVPAASALTFAGSLPSGQATTNLQSGDTINIDLSGVENGDTIQYQITSTDIQPTGNSISIPSINMPYGFLTGSANTNLVTTGVANPSMVVSYNDGSSITLTPVSGSTITSSKNISPGDYSVTINGTQTGSAIGVNYVVSGTVSGATSPSGTLSLKFADIYSGDVTITITDTKTTGASQSFSQLFTIVTPTTQVNVPLSSGVVQGTTPTDVTTNSSAATFTSTVSLPPGTTVVTPSGTSTLSITPTPPATVPDTSYAQRGTTFSFSGLAVTCGPTGTTFAGGSGVTISFTLTDDQWATALSNAGGNPAGMTIETYENGAWVSVPTTVDSVNHIVTATITHFSTYALFSSRVASTAASTGSSGGGGGGAAVGAAPAAAAPNNGQLAPPGFVTTTVSLSHDATGVISQDYTLQTDPTAGFSSSVGITKGTQVTSSTGMSVDKISVVPVNPTSLPAGQGSTYSFSGLAIDCEPTGTQFTGGSATVSFSLTAAQWAAAISAVDGNTAAMSIQTYDATTSTWTTIPTTVDPVNHVVSAQITHFSTYALFYQVASQTVTSTASTSTPSPQGTMLAPPQTTPTPANQDVVGNFVNWVQHII
jgi:hypothetical protein